MVKSIDKYNEQLCALIASKQDLLISGDTIKTINGQSLLGSGDITIPGGGGTLVALPFTTDHIAATGNPYLIGDLVWYGGNVYRCIANNDSLQPDLAPAYWVNLGAGYPLVQQPSDWNAATGNNQILNKPTIPTVGTWGALNYPTWVSDTPFVKMTAVGTFALDTNTYLTSAVTSVTATAPLVSSGGNTPDISTSMATNRLIGRSTAGVGVMEEITIGSGLTLSGGTLTAAGGGITIGTTAIASGTIGRLLFQGTGDVVQQSTNLFWDNTNSRLALGTSSPIASTRLTVLGSGITSSTFGLQIHNSTGTNNALVVRDDGRVGIGTASPNGQLTILSGTASVDYTTSPTYNLGQITGGLYIKDTAQGITGNNGYIEVSTENANANILGSMINLSSGLTTNNSSLKLLTTHDSAAVSSYTAGRTYIVADKRTGGGSSQLQFGVQNSGTATASMYWTGGNAANTIAGSHIGMQLDFSSLGSGAPSETAKLSINGATNTAILNVKGTGNTQATYGLQIHNSTGNNNSFIVSDLGNIGIGTTSAGTSATKTLVINNGTAPSGNVTDSFQQYSADVVAGNAAPHFRTENGNVVKIYQETTGIVAAAFVANTSLIANDTATFGGYTIGQVVAALKAQGLLA